MLGDNGNKRAIRILLECILVKMLLLVDGGGGSRISQTGAPTLKVGRMRVKKIDKDGGNAPLDPPIFSHHH